jgi:hypothetical protein
MLEVFGVHYATVRKVGKAAPSSGDIAPTLREWEPADLKTSSYLTGQNLLDAYVATLWMGNYAERWGPNFPNRPLAQLRDTYLSCVSDSQKSVDEGTGNNHTLCCLRQWTKNHTFLQTERHIGLGPPAAEPG